MTWEKFLNSVSARTLVIAAAITMSACSGEGVDDPAASSDRNESVSATPAADASSGRSDQDDVDASEADASEDEARRRSRPYAYVVDEELSVSERLEALERDIEQLLADPDSDDASTFLAPLLTHRMMLRQGGTAAFTEVQSIRTRTNVETVEGTDANSYALAISEDGFIRIEAISRSLEALLIRNELGTLAGTWRADTGALTYLETLQGGQALQAACELLVPAVGYSIFRICYQSPELLGEETFDGEPAHRIRFTDALGLRGEIFLTLDGDLVGDRRYNDDGEITVERRFLETREVGDATLIKRYEVFDGEQVIATYIWSPIDQAAPSEDLFRFDPETGQPAVMPGD